MATIMGGYGKGDVERVMWEEWCGKGDVGRMVWE